MWGLDTMPTVSIAMTTFNGEKYLADQLDSFLTQTRMPDELVVRDDGSTDDTLKILNNFARSAQFTVRILSRGPRLGYVENFLTTAAACQSEYIAFSDQDDVWMPEKIQIGLDAMLRHHSLMSMHTSIVTDENLIPIAIAKQGIKQSMTYDPGELNPHENGWGHQIMFRHDVLKTVPAENRPLSPRGKQLPHDIWVYVLASALGRVSHIDEPLCKYRQHSDNTDGANLTGLRTRISNAISVPIYRYEYRYRFCEAMRLVFKKAEASAVNDDEKLLYRRASAIYEKRRDGTQIRIGLYRTTSFAKRVRAFLSPRRLDDHEIRKLYNVRLLADLRDILLGVLHLGRIREDPHRAFSDIPD